MKKALELLSEVVRAALYLAALLIASGTAVWVLRHFPGVT